MGESARRHSKASPSCAPCRVLPYCALVGPGSDGESETRAISNYRAALLSLALQGKVEFDIVWDSDTILWMMIRVVFWTRLLLGSVDYG